MSKNEIRSAAKGAEKLIKLAEKLTKGDALEGIRLFQYGLYALKVQENPDIPPPYEWH